MHGGKQSQALCLLCHISNHLGRKTGRNFSNNKRPLAQQRQHIITYFVCGALTRSGAPPLSSTTAPWWQCALHRRCFWRCPLSTRVSSGALSLPPALFPLSDSTAYHSHHVHRRKQARRAARSSVGISVRLACLSTLIYPPASALSLRCFHTWWWNVWTEVITKECKHDPVSCLSYCDPHNLSIVVHWATVVLISSYLVIFNNLLCFWVYYSWFIGGHKWVTHRRVKELTYFL
jgi:hypothetical protein